MERTRGPYSRSVVGTFGKGLAGAALAALAALAMPAAASAFDPILELKNFAKIGERFQHIVLTPEFQARLLQANVDNLAETAEIQLSDPERLFANICGTRTNECAGDVRFYDWNADGAGIRTPVLFTARSGATLSGNVWATDAGPQNRPAIVITTGSVQAPETLYWGQAATLAKHGYVVLTYDVQGQGRSDVLGEAPDATEGVPSQAGQPFYDGTEDALDFLLSTPEEPYVPRPSCGNANGGVGTSHAPKQDRRVEDGFNAGFNPLHGLVDPDRIGIAGHSLGASAVSYVGQIDPRVDAITAWDNLRPPGDGGAFDAPGCPSTPDSRPETVTLHKARAWNLERLRDHSDPVHGRSGSPGGKQRVPRLPGRGRRHDAGEHPRRHPRGVRLHPRQHDRPDATRRSHPSRLGPHRLVHDGLVRPLRQVPGPREPAIL